MASRLDALSNALGANNFYSDVDTTVFRGFEDLCRPFWMGAVIDDMTGSKLFRYFKLLIRGRCGDNSGSER